MAIIQSPLSRSLQGGLIQSRVSGGIFGGGLVGARGMGVGDDETKELLTSNQSTLTNISSQIDSLRGQIQTINLSIASIASGIDSGTTAESLSAEADRKYQRQLQERQVRVGQESALETKIQDALSKPVVALQNKVSNVFGNVGNALKTLFLGWLFNQGLEALQANAQGNKEKLTSIRNEVLKAFAFIVAGGGVLSIIKAAIGGITRTVINLAARIGGLVIKGLFIKPFELVINTLRGGFGKVASGGAAAAAAATSVKPPKGPGLFATVGKVFTGISGVFNFLNGENVDSALAAISLMPATGKVGFAIKGAAGLAFTIDEIMELLGKNFTGADPKKLAEKKKELEEAKKKQKSQPTAKTEPAVKPMQTAMGAPAPSTEPKSLSLSPTTSTPKETLMPSAPTAEAPSMNIMPVPVTPPSTGTESQAPTPAKVDSAAPAQPITPMMGTGKEGSEADLPSGDREKVIDAKSITPAQTSSPSMAKPSVGPVEKPKPVVNISTIPSQQKSAPPSRSSKPITEVPNILSSNPDNFYTLFSQLTYNVVM